MTNDHLIPEKKVLEMLSVSRTYMWRLRKEGKIRAITQGGGRVYYRPSDISDYIDSLEQISAPAPTCHDC